MYRENEFDSPSSQELHRADSASDGLTGIVFDVKRYAVHDGPGIRTTVFLKGCPLRCLWCHNPESWHQAPEQSLRPSQCRACGRCVEHCPQQAIACRDNVAVTDPEKCVACGRCLDACAAGAREIVGREVRLSEIIAEIERDVVFYDESGGGVTISGGEPLMQHEFTAALAAECQRRHLHTALDTTCHAAWCVIEAFIDNVDLFLCDLKHMDSAAHERLTGVPNELILENIRRIAQRDKAMILRVPVIPGLNDSDENFAAVGEFAQELDGVDRLDLLPYNEVMQAKVARLAKPYELWQAKTPDRQRMDELAGRLSEYGLHVKVDG
jgi:pyruvate formate lyase activating enzyme